MRSGPIPQLSERLPKCSRSAIWRLAAQPSARGLVVSVPRPTGNLTEGMQLGFGLPVSGAWATPHARPHPHGRDTYSLTMALQAEVSGGIP